MTQHLAKFWEKVDCLNRPVHRGNFLLKDEELAWYWHMTRRTVVTLTQTPWLTSIRLV